jgi:hypothetical protein
MTGVILLAAAGPAAAGSGIGLELFGGVAFNVPTSLTVRQAGADDLELTAHYRTRPFQQPVYWSVRLFWQRVSTSWAIQFMHHKLYLDNNPPEIQHFEVTHGFNILTVQHAWRRPNFSLRLGAGVVLPNSDSVVRGQSYADGGSGLGSHYKIGGPALMAGVGKQFSLNRHFFVSTEGQLTAAWATVTVAEGEADVFNLALHFLLGIGYGFQL